LTTATNATATKKMGKGKKAAAKGRKPKKKAEVEPEIEPEAVEVLETVAPEPEDDDFEPKVVVAPKATRGRKRKTEDTPESVASVVESARPIKRRATRTRGSVAVDNSVLDESSIAQEPVKKPVRKGRASTRKASTASVMSVQASVPNDDEIDAALEADLDRHMSDDEVISKKTTKSSKIITTSDYDMFGTKPKEIDEAEIDAELDAMELDMKPLPKAKGAKGKQPRKVSAKQQAAAKKAAEVAAVLEQQVEEDDPSQQIATELENSISMQHSSPVLQPKKQRATSRQPQGKKGTRASALSVGDRSVSTYDQESEHQHHADSGNETDASMASQSTIVRGGKAGRPTKKGKVGKSIRKNIEDIVHTSVGAPKEDRIPVASGNKDAQMEDMSMAYEKFYTPAPEVQPVVSTTQNEIARTN